MKMNKRLLPAWMQDFKAWSVLADMKTMIRLLPVSLALFLFGCGPGYTFTPWTGAQDNWSTGPGGYVRMVDNVPVFSPGQFPPRPYVLLCAVVTDSEHRLARAARDQHADAVLLSRESVHRSGSIAWGAPGVYGVSPITSTTITANLIRYK
jgi:hypothetical protein